MVTGWSEKIFLFVLMLLILINAQAATISVTPDRDPVPRNESFQLLFEAEGSVDGDPDFSPLNQYLQILSTSQSSNFSLINGQLSSSKSWRLTVIAKQAGRITLPPIAFGKDSSPALEIEVVSNSPGTASGGQDDEIFLEVTATPGSPFVQAQVIYTLKLYRSVAIANASLSDPEVSTGDALIRRLEEDKSYTTRLHGKSYQVIERRFAVYPQSSGLVTIAPISFMGQIVRNSFSLLDPFGPQPKTTVRSSDPITLDVKPVPDSFPGAQWIPAENLTIAEEWSVDPSALEVGTPVTRTLVLTAHGQTSSQLPELPEWGIAQLKYYPDQPALSDDRSASGYVGTRREKAAIIPGQAGSYRLPGISIPWWNTVTGKIEYAEIPERTLQVHATAMADNAVVSQAPVQPDLTNGIDITVTGDAAEEPAPAVPVGTEITDLWKWVSLAMVIVWLVTMLIWIRSTHRNRRPGSHHTPGSNSSSAAVREVVEACKRNDPARVRESLLHWGRLVWAEDPPINTSDIGRRTGTAMAVELQRLNDVLYSSTRKDWTADALCDAFKKEAGKRHINNRPEDKGRLEPLYRI